MHGLRTIIFLNRNNREAAARLNASDPGHRETRRAEDDLAEAVARALVPEAGADQGTTSPTTEFGHDFFFQVHGTEGWLLPISNRGRDICNRMFPAGSRRYGLHYILDLASDRDDAILQSIRATYE